MYVFHYRPTPLTISYLADILPTMPARIKLRPHEHVCGEWNIISMNCYLPISNGDNAAFSDASRAREMYLVGMAIGDIADTLNTTQAVIRRCLATNWQEG